jgi:hypothetical protein
MKLNTVAVALVLAFVAASYIAEPDAQAPQGRGAPGVQGRGGRGGRGAGGPPRARTRKVVLAWADTRNGIAQHESVSHALSVIEQLGYESGAYDTFIRTDSNIIAKQPLRTTGEPASGGPSLATPTPSSFWGTATCRSTTRRRPSCSHSSVTRARASWPVTPR